MRWLAGHPHEARIREIMRLTPEIAAIVDLDDPQSVRWGSEIVGLLNAERVRLFRAPGKPICKHSFTAWLKLQRRRNDSVGDLARDICRDPDWPQGRTWRAFAAYLAERNACEGAQEALDRAWGEHQQHRQGWLAQEKEAFGDALYQEG